MSLHGVGEILRPTGDHEADCRRILDVVARELRELERTLSQALDGLAERVVLAIQASR